MNSLKQIAALTVLACMCGSIVLAEASEQYISDGNMFYQKYLITKNKELLDKAYINYYKASESEPSASSYLGMGMVFIEKQMNARAKKYLYKAYSIDENDAAANYYLAKYSYNNEDYLKALEFYKKAYSNGLSENYDVNEKLGSIYEKVGDLKKAKSFYTRALTLNPESQLIRSRLLELESLENSAQKYIGGN